MLVLVGLDDDARHHERRAAQFEEVGGGAHLVHRENVGKDVAEEFFEVVGGCHVVAVVGLNDGCGQCLAVHLLVLVERYARNLHRGRRNHVGRLLLTDEVIQRLHIDRPVAYDVGGDKLSSVLVVEGLHGGILDAGILETAYLHLSVLAADKLDVAIGQVAHDVARAVAASVFLVGISKRISDVHLGGLLWTVQVAAAHLRTAHPQFAAGTLGQTVALLVDDVETEVVERLADGDVQLLVLHPVVRRRIERRQLLATHGEEAQRVVVGVRGKLIAHLGGDERMGNQVLFEILVQVGQVQADVVADDVDAGTAGHCGIDVHHAGVETVAGIGCHMASLAEFEATLIPVAEARRPDTLRPAVAVPRRR